MQSWSAEGTYRNGGDCGYRRLKPSVISAEVIGVLVLEFPFPFPRCWKCTRRRINRTHLRVPLHRAGSRTRAMWRSDSSDISATRARKGLGGVRGLLPLRWVFVESDRCNQFGWGGVGHGLSKYSDGAYGDQRRLYRLLQLDIRATDDDTRY